MSIPGGEAPHFVILQTDRFAGLETFLDFPSLPDRLNHLDQGRTQWREDKVVGLLARIVHTSADQQKVSTIIGAPMQHRHHGPIEQSWPLGPLTHRKPLPILLAA